MRPIAGSRSAYSPYSQRTANGAVLHGTWRTFPGAEGVSFRTLWLPARAAQAYLPEPCGVR